MVNSISFGTLIERFSSSQRGMAPSGIDTELCNPSTLGWSDAEAWKGFRDFYAGNRSWDRLSGNVAPRVARGPDNAALGQLQLPLHPD